MTIDAVGFTFLLVSGLLLALIVVLGFPAVVMGQAGASGSFPPLPPIGLPLPAIGLPLPPIGLPLPLIGLPAPPAGIDTRSGANGHPSRRMEIERVRHRQRPTFRSQPTVIYVVPDYAWGNAAPINDARTVLSINPVNNSSGPIGPDSNSAVDQPTQGSVTGSLRLEMAPRTALQVYVDGYYVGTPDDFNGAPALEGGLHNIEIRAPGYETVNFDVKIVPNRSITYRGVLNPQKVEATPQPEPFVSTGPATFYLIPGCYVGNIPPKDVRLPATCDPSRVMVFER